MTFKLRPTSMAAALTVVALATTACSGSSSDESSSGAVKSTAGVAAAQTYVDKLTANPTSIVLDTPLKKKPQPGKSVIYLKAPTGLAGRTDEGQKAAAETLGWSYSSIDTGATPATAVSAFEAALAKKPDAIIFGGYPAAVFTKQLQEAKKAGIVVISGATGDGPTDGVLADVAGGKQTELYARLTAAYFVANAGAQGEAVVVNIKGFPVTEVYTKAFVAAVKEWCPGCTTDVLNQQITDIGTKAPANVVGYLQRKPSVKWTVFVVGDLAQGASAAIKTAGLNGIKIIGEVPSAADLANVRSGAETAWVALPIDVVSWRMMDTLARSFDGSDVAEAVGVSLPIQMVDKANIDTIVTDGDYFVGVDGYQEQFKKLWQVG